MKFYRRLWFIVVVALAPFLPEGCGGLLFAQQDAQYSQYKFNPIAINPAYAGSRDAFSTAFVHRNQWVKIKGAPVTAALSCNTPLKNNRIGLGAEVFSDKLGPRSSSALLISYAYRIPFSTGKLALGLKTGLFNYVYDWAALDFKENGDMYDISTRSSKLSGTADFGIYYNSRTFYWGLSATHLNRGRMSEFQGDSARQAMHYFMMFGKSFKRGNTLFNPTLLIKSATNAPAMADLGLNILIKERWWVGASLRSNYGMVFLSQYHISENLRIGYSYDWGRNRIGHAGGGSHEIMIGYDLNRMGPKISMPRYL